MIVSSHCWFWLVSPVSRAELHTWLSSTPSKRFVLCWLWHGMCSQPQYAGAAGRENTSALLSESCRLLIRLLFFSLSLALCKKARTQLHPDAVPQDQHCCWGSLGPVGLRWWEQGHFCSRAGLMGGCLGGISGDLWPKRCQGGSSSGSRSPVHTQGASHRKIIFDV